ncbi:MAG: phosphoglucosamine mutase [Pyrinomonadaceae bacterium]|jgi:phosphoglucosamine mutase|nr:phosphoglucosamine mutase [Pyrinomonadaceae bacterium]
MKKLFGTDGMRGEAGKFPLDAATIEIVGASLANHLREKLGRAPLIVVGRDTRESGPWLEQALARGATSAGAELQSGGVITTPGVAYLARSLSADAGVVISASHNPYQDNGLKVFAPGGKKLDEETERLIETDIFAQTETPGAATVKGSESTQVSTNTIETSPLQLRYLDYLADEIGRGLSLAGIKLVVDCANGAASALAPALLERLGATVIAINNGPDGRNINLNCGSLHTEQLQSEVLKQQADLGVAFDGDADRSLFVDAKGQLVNGDGSLWVLAKYLHERNELTHKTVVATVMSNVGLELALKSRGLTLVRTDVGDKYVLDELLRSGATLGGEQSGHIILPKLSLAGDGLITTLSVLRVIVEENKSLHQLTEGFEVFPQVLVNVKVAQKRPFAELPSINKVAREIENEIGTRGRLLLRYSGTESLARVMIEGESQSQIEGFANRLAAAIKETLG